MAFGTGAVKVTPAHDFNDFATGKRHGLEEINILNLDGTMNAQGGEFAGLERFEARKAVKKRARRAGPRARQQAAQDDAAALAAHEQRRRADDLDAVVREDGAARRAGARRGARRAHARSSPRSGRRRTSTGSTNIHDWCISRQLWWGHRIPAFHCQACGHVTVTREDAPTACSKCGSAELVQDPDVLDTWFSSALWPFSTLGWPEQTPALAQFYPASDLETGYDILFFWVARMMMMGLHFMGDAPFKRVLLHGMVVDETGDKMSKVKGNVHRPARPRSTAPTFDDVVEKALPGAPRGEALRSSRRRTRRRRRWARASRRTAPTRCASRLPATRRRPSASRSRRSASRATATSATRSGTRRASRSTYLKDEKPSGKPPRRRQLLAQSLDPLAARARRSTASTAGIDEFRLDDASKALYRFFWDELCDWYLEMTKPVFADGSAEAQAETRATLAHVLEVVAARAAPVHAVHHRRALAALPKAGGSPGVDRARQLPDRADGRVDADAERDMGWLTAVISAARTVRSEHGIKFSQRVPLELRSADAAVRQVLSDNSRMIQFLASTDGPPTVAEPSAQRPARLDRERGRRRRGARHPEGSHRSGQEKSSASSAK